MNNDKFYTISELKNLCGLGHKSVTKAIHSGLLKAKKESNRWVVSENEFQKWKNNSFKLENEVIIKLKKVERTAEFNEIDISSEFNIKKHTQNFTFIDIFAGAGGISTGLTMAGGKGICALEIMPEACQTYSSNFKHPILNEDVRKQTSKNELYKIVKKYFNTDKIEELVDVVTGGFPCQGFSMAGNRVVDDERNSLYKELKEIVNCLKPKFIFMENVVGLRTMLDGKVEEKILQDFEEIGYKIQVKILNSADYGVPQTRQRVIFIGNRIGKINYHPKAILKKEKYKTVRDAIYDLQNKDVTFCENHIVTKHKPEMSERLKSIKPGKSLYENFSDAWKKIEWDKPSCTIKENHGGVNVHPELGRVITPREMARLQSFPDDFKFKGAKKWQLVQLGNAVPPLMAKAVGLAIKKSLFE
ncbi:DNA cytosine methyltransferase [Aliarcobacter butzleri]|uniref:DNA cytosine methyltransferase n=1 Tax=Aliarcobacter butzleri TaxID=28197 RepID=UPI002874EF9D|nr:DNA cytosine methyltransferase [Aliarcobacter butzleri]MDS1315729.1 DNA cytosine methyltransferase [Aliarcobacter butzleri]